MSENKKLFSAKEAALAVLTKTKEILQDSSLMKSEKLKKDGTLGQAIGYPGSTPSPTPSPSPMMGKAEYPTENDPKPGIKYGKIEKDQKKLERDYDEYEVKKPSSKDSDGPRLARQVSPSSNPKEEAEGNNKPGGMEPEYEFKNKVAKELAKEKASHMVKSQSGMHTVVYQTAAIEKSEGEENDLKKSLSGKEDRSKMSGKTGMLRTVETGHEKGVHTKGNQGESQGMSSAGAHLRETQYLSPNGAAASAAKAKEGHKKVLGEMKQMPKPKLGKNENPDEKQDAELGEQVEKDVEQHFKENKEAEAQEGHELMAKPGDKVEGQSEQASIPRLILSAKLSKFMEYRHAKKKAAQGAQSQAAAAVGHEASNAPQAGSGQAGQPDNCRPKTQPTKGDSDKV